MSSPLTPSLPFFEADLSSSRLDSLRLRTRWLSSIPRGTLPTIYKPWIELSESDRPTVRLLVLSSFSSLQLILSLFRRRGVQTACWWIDRGDYLRPVSPTATTFQSNLAHSFFSLPLLRSQIYKRQSSNIGYDASMEKRNFAGIMGNKSHEGELFGLKNVSRPPLLFVLSSPSSLTLVVFFLVFCSSSPFERMASE